MMHELKKHVEEIVDIEDFAVNRFNNDKTLMNTMFWECGEDEFHFIERSGACASAHVHLRMCVCIALAFALACAGTRCTREARVRAWARARACRHARA